jgi:hypothetical protein
MSRLTVALWPSRSGVKLARSLAGCVAGVIAGTHAHTASSVVGR